MAIKLPKINLSLKKKILKSAKFLFWFSVGALIGIFFLASFTTIIFQKLNEGKIYPGILIGGIDFSGKTQEDVRTYFKNKNDKIKDTNFVFKQNENIATASASQVDLGYNYELLATQAYGIGRSGNSLSDVSTIIQGYLNGINLSPSFGYSSEKLDTILQPIYQKAKTDPVDSVFTFQNGRVTVFKPSRNGQIVDDLKLKEKIALQVPSLVLSEVNQTIEIDVPVKTIEPQITTEKANDMGIKELIGTGTSLFRGSIPGRVHNVNLAASRLNGILVKPDEVFSFNKMLGDVSAFTGYKQAYIIQNGRTVLGDGGGVCQVSTTLFRAILNAGLPIAERHAHAYRVGYYEQDSGPGLDATVFSPSVDLKFKNDTGHHILIQTSIDPSSLRLTFELYGTNDGRIANVSKPIITSQSAPPPDIHQDDPAIPKGEVRQTEHSAWGANVYFTREVTKNGQVIISEKFSSAYRPWPAVYLHGTKEG